MKSVPNFISYLQEFFWNFSQFLAIYFELFSYGSKFNSENTDEWGLPVSRRFPRRACLAARRRPLAATCPCRMHRSRALSALSGPHANVSTAPPLFEPRRCLALCALIPTVPSPGPKLPPCCPKLTDAVRAPR
jgi:hypothetical protein